MWYVHNFLAEISFLKIFQNLKKKNVRNNVRKWPNFVFYETLKGLEVEQSTLGGDPVLNGGHNRSGFDEIEIEVKTRPSWSLF